MVCRHIGVPFDLSENGRNTIISLLERHETLGTTLFGGYEGVDYSQGKLDERWITQPNGRDDGGRFAWAFESGEYDWAMKRLSHQIRDLWP